MKLPVRLPGSPIRNEGQSYAHLDADEVSRFSPPQEVTVEVFEGFITSIDTGKNVVLTWASPQYQVNERAWLVKFVTYINLGLFVLLWLGYRRVR